MKKHEIKCQTCGKKKMVQRFWAKFCSPKCRLIAWAKTQGKPKTTVAAVLALMLLTGNASANVVSVAVSHIGHGEVGADNSGAWVEKYTGGQRVSWCAAFVSYALKESGVEVPRLLAARSFLKYGKQVERPASGDVVVFSRGAKQGHVAIIEKVTPKGLWIIEGNHGAYPAKVKRSFVVPGEKGREVLGYSRFGHARD